MEKIFKKIRNILNNFFGRKNKKMLIEIKKETLNTNENLDKNTIKKDLAKNTNIQLQKAKKIKNIQEYISKNIVTIHNISFTKINEHKIDGHVIGQYVEADNYSKTIFLEEKFKKGKLIRIPVKDKKILDKLYNICGVVKKDGKIYGKI